jgi:hypothetical protein
MIRKKAGIRLAKVSLRKFLKADEEKRAQFNHYQGISFIKIRKIFSRPIQHKTHF